MQQAGRLKIVNRQVSLTPDSNTNNPSIVTQPN